MNSFAFYYISIFFCLMLSCRGKEKGYIANGTPIMINLDSSIKHYSLVDYIDSPYLVTLDTCKESILSEAWGIQKVIYKEGKYFILDGKYMAIKVFDTMGRYLYSIGSLGMGKGEFVRVDNMEYYPSHNSLMVLCNRPSKICEYALDGHLIKDSGLDFFSTDFAFPSESERIFYVNQNVNEVSGRKNILFTDSSNNIESRIFELPRRLTGTIKFSGGLYSTGQDIYFNPAFSSVFYSIINDTAMPAFEVTYGAKSIPMGITMDSVMMNLSKYSFQYGTFIKTPDYVGFNYRSSYVSTAFFNLHSKDVLIADKGLDSLNTLFANLMFQNGPYCIMVLDMRRLSGFLKRNAKAIQQRFPAIYSQIAAKSTYPNPALLIFKPRAVF